MDEAPSIVADRHHGIELHAGYGRNQTKPKRHCEYSPFDTPALRHRLPRRSHRSQGMNSQEVQQSLHTRHKEKGTHKEKGDRSISRSRSEIDLSPSPVLSPNGCCVICRRARRAKRMRRAGVGMGSEGRRIADAGGQPSPRCENPLKNNRTARRTFSRRGASNPAASNP